MYHSTKNKTLIFDLDNTLILRDEAMINCIEKMFEIQLSEQQKKEIKKQDQHGHSDRISFCHWLQFFLRIPLEVEIIWDLIKKNIGYFVTLQKDSIAILKQLQSQHELVLFTNGGIENQHRKIAQAGLNQFFSPEKIFISQALGYKKPDPKAFQLVQDKFHKNTRFCMIGDHWENDILGAVNFGWQAVHLSSIKEGIPFKNVIRIASLSELIKGLNELEYFD